MAFVITAGTDRLTAELYAYLNEQFLQGQLINCKLKIELLDDGEMVRVALWVKHLPSEEAFAALRHSLAAVLYLFIRHVLAADYLEEQLQREYDALSQVEKKQVGNILQREKDQYWEYAKANHVLDDLPDLLADYLAEASQLHLIGFLRFRLPGYFPLLRKVLHRAVERYQVEKEYQAFIDLIQCFIQSQKSKISLVHVVWEQGRHFCLLDSEHRSLKQEWWQQADNIAMEGSYDDVLISTLLYLLPERIVLHTGCGIKAPNIALTIQKMFHGRALLCAGCKLCRAVMEHPEK